MQTIGPTSASIPIETFGPPSKAPDTPSQICQTPEPTHIEVYPSYATEERVVIRGRVLEKQDVSEAKPEDSAFTNLIRNLSFLESDEVKRVPVKIEFAGKTIETRTDRDGLFEVALSGVAGLAPGYHDVKVSMVGTPEYGASEAVGKLVVQCLDDRSFGVISDIDDTLQFSYAANKLKAAQTLLLGNETTLKPVPGMAALYRELEASDGQKDGDISYLSGSPMNYAGRIQRFMQAQGFPEGAIQLKNMGFRAGEDHPLSQSDYKLNHLRNMFETYPEKSFFLFGDSGEEDPEIYRQIAQEYPDRIQGIFIHNVTNEDTQSERFKDLHVIRSGADAAEILYEQGILAQEALRRIQDATPHKAGK